MTVNMWKSYMWTVGKEMNMERILTIKNTTWATGKIRPEKKIQACTRLKPMILWYLCSTLPTELTSQLGAGCYVGSK